MRTLVHGRWGGLTKIHAVGKRRRTSPARVRCSTRVTCSHASCPHCHTYSSHVQMPTATGASFLFLNGAQRPTQGHLSPVTSRHWPVCGFWSKPPASLSICLPAVDGHLWQSFPRRLGGWSRKHFIIHEANSICRHNSLKGTSGTPMMDGSLASDLIPINPEDRIEPHSPSAQANVCPAAVSKHLAVGLEPGRLHKSLLTISPWAHHSEPQFPHQ